MSISTPLTASSNIQRITPATINKPQPSPLKPAFTNLGEFSADILEISKQGIVKQQTETQISASKEINKIATDAVRVSSSIGRAQSQGNLSNKQAIELYNKIARLL